MVRFDNRATYSIPERGFQPLPVVPVAREREDGEDGGDGVRQAGHLVYPFVGDRAGPSFRLGIE